MFERIHLKAVVVILVAACFGGGACLIACSSSDTGPGGAGATGTVPDSGATNNDTGATPVDAGTDADDEVDAEAGVNALGVACTGNGDCQSLHCITQGTGGGGGGGDGGGMGGGKPGSFCSVPCATVNQDPAPECTDPAFTGKCSGKKLCQVK